MTRVTRIGKGISYIAISILLNIPTKSPTVGDPLGTALFTWQGGVFVAAVIAASCILMIHGICTLIGEESPF